MLLAINIENKIINAGVYSGKTQMATFDLSTCAERTSDEYGVTIVNILLAKRFDLKEIDSAVISSNVPELVTTFKKALECYLRCTPLVSEEGGSIDNLVEFYEKNAPAEKESRGILI